MRGGTNEERLYLDSMPELGIERTNMPNMTELVARHKARYYLVGFFCRPGMRVLDFPCGSGYASEILGPLGVEYEGKDLDLTTISYCRAKYSGVFSVGDLMNPELVESFYDVVACIDGLEHIEKSYQENLLRAFHWTMKPDGILIVSTPEKKGETVNPYHKHELTNLEFRGLLGSVFSNYQILRVEDTLHNGTKTNLMMGVCRKKS